MKKYISILIILTFTGLMCSCSIPFAPSDSMLGLWEFDYSENQDPDSVNINLDIKEENIIITNILDGQEISMDAEYYRDDKNIYITSASVAGKKMPQDEIITMPYTFLSGNKLMWDMSVMGLGRYVFKKK